MDSTKSAVISGGLILEKIASFEPPHIFTSDTIGINVTIVAGANREWYKAGYLYQYFAAPLGISGLAVGQTNFIKLFTPTIIKMRDFPSGYQVSFDVPRYFEDCTVKIWEFTG